MKTLAWEYFLENQGLHYASLDVQDLGKLNVAARQNNLPFFENSQADGPVSDRDENNNAQDIPNANNSQKERLASLKRTADSEK